MDWMGAALLLTGLTAGAAAGALFTKQRLERRAAAWSEQLVTLRNERDWIRESCAAAESEARRLREEESRQREEVARLNAMLEAEVSRSNEKLQALNEARDSMKADFQNLAQRIFDEKSRVFADQNKSSVVQLLEPLREQLGDFKRKVEDVHVAEARERAALLKEISHLKDLNQTMTSEASNLTRALKADTRVQGHWGEMVLESLLENSGLRKGENYVMREKRVDAEGRRRHPDAIVRLPDDKDVVIDAKVSLTAYARYASAASEAERDHALKEHIESVAGHVRDLSEKRYDELDGVRSLDFVLMFIPVEPAFCAALAGKSDLFDQALRSNIALVSPSTLMATLRIVANLWRTENQNRHALRIAEKAGDLHDKFVGFIESMDEIGRRLDQARNAYRDGYSKLTDGRGNLVRRSRELVEMGVKTRKKIPSKHMED